MEGSSVEFEAPNIKFEYTPTWIIAVVCSIIVLISLCAERGLHRLGKLLLHKEQDALYKALQKLKEELMLLGFISLLLTVFQTAISHVCMPPSFANYMLPCKRRKASSLSNTHHFYTTNNIGRHLLSSNNNVAHCIQRGKVPLLSLEALHQLHIFIFVLTVAHVIFCATTMLLASAKIRQWKVWEDSTKHDVSHSRKEKINEEFVKEYVQGYWRKAAVISWMKAFAKQFHGSITKSDYLSLRRGFIMEHCPRNRGFNFYGYMTRTLEHDFKKVVGISWYLWIFVVLFLLLNLEGWHTYFWLSFLPLILLLLVGAKLEHIITKMAQESDRKAQDNETQPQPQQQQHQHQHQQDDHHHHHRNKKSPIQIQVKPSDQHFWFASPSLVLNLIHFILFQNSFEIAFFFWIWTTYGFKSCIMEKPVFIITRLFMGVLVQVLCSFGTLPLYTIVTQMGSKYKKGMFDQKVEETLISWAEETRRKRNADSERSLIHDFDSQESSQHVQIPQPNEPFSIVTNYNTNNDSIASESETH